MHKIPATLGLGTFLTHAKLPTKEYFMHMLSFTFCSPIFAIISYHILQSTGLENESKKVLGLWVGVLLMLSAGTFIYVATIQILPEVFNSKLKQQLEKTLTGKQRAINRLVELALIQVGMYSPLVLQKMVHH